MHWRSLSVPPSVCLSRADHKSRTEGDRKKKTDMKEAHDTCDPWPHLEVERSKVKVTGPINAVTENEPYLRNRKAYELQICYTDGVRRSSTCAVTSKLKALCVCSSHHLQGRGNIVVAQLQAAQLVKITWFNNRMRADHAYLHVVLQSTSGYFVIRLGGFLASVRLCLRRR